ncbi:venom dipeptidyl peptidase 4-like isoform X1 [Cataglyphis hispanica]|uniref:venom dipeptidyl peptidase 4-like isoform X1 n=1 Tax=Cataglyphis hispanica TaxID=1086592 RepID=UPI00217FE714|nr:venom dipeptidyl peptidase 4-like isoform X1 [Cataglyphis hispanica]XP_050453785.1 venom dipeptidyl peptidase 4-like isoform X1 [Cataglyphis hispanica]XP_050453787.1 venom dipeptidyl peptidase 4-like isoform X1 [Cataglyphis hispanica]XP_050453788.1 venom dipeptidyl peptidase 4-like isoform X1 [Cataglyphis hispanica]
MAVRHYAHQYTMRLTDEKNTDANVSSENSDMEDYYPLIHHTMNNAIVDVSARRRGKGTGWNETVSVHRVRIISLITDSDLMTKNKQRYRWRLLLCGIVFIIVLALVIAAAILLTGSPNSTSSRTNGAPGISLEEWLSGSLSPKSFNGTWISGNEILYRDEIGNLLIYNVSSATSKILLDSNNPALLSSFDHQLSADKKYLLLALNYQKLYRHTYLAHYRIVNLETLTETILAANESTPLQLATWGPRGNALIYVHQNNIYYRPEAEVANDYQITNTGVFGTIYNGVPDWVYEEEVFSSNKALWFSPSGNKIAFGYFDDSNTPIMTIPFYGYPGSLTFQYTSAIPIHYPKSGTTNPRVKLFCVDLEMVVQGNVTLVEIEHPPELSATERILSAVAFPTDNLVYATWMNRVQNEAYFQLCDVDSLLPNCTVALSYSEEKGWVEQFEAPMFNENGTSFLLILPQKQKNGSNWRHIALVTNATSGKPTTTALTSGYFVVTEIVSWDQEDSYLYYLATSKHNSAVQHLYRVSLLDMDHKSVCLTCNIVREKDGSRCLYNSAIFSTDNSHYVLTCAGPGVPDITIYNKNSTLLFVWEDNNAVTEIIVERSQPIVQKYKIPVPGGFNAQVRLLIPPGADLSGSTKYPMLVYVYGGPDSYQVTEKFNMDWGMYLVTNKSIIYAAIDGRGSGLMGNDMLFAGYRQLGTVEIIDQINVTRHLQNKLSFIDRTRTAIWGWSYGGYATGMTLAMDLKGVFKCGMSVAPVTDWALYDSIYTERFMGLPTVGDNLQGYEQGQLLNKVENIKNKMYYLIHGTLDDNVHYQQSLMLAKVLEQKDILFRQQTYTDEDHGIAQSRAHLYHSLENFLDECFQTSS